jgi:hypothetical protein
MFAAVRAGSKQALPLAGAERDVPDHRPAAHAGDDQRAGRDGPAGDDVVVVTSSCGGVIVVTSSCDDVIIVTSACDDVIIASSACDDVVIAISACDDIISAPHPLGPQAAGQSGRPQLGNLAAHASHACLAAYTPGAGAADRPEGHGRLPPLGRSISTTRALPDRAGQVMASAPPPLLDMLTSASPSPS